MSNGYLRKKGQPLYLHEEDIIAELHLKGKEYINHFSTIKLRYKKLAMSWAAAYLLGLAYISFYEEQVIHINKLYLIFFVTILAAIGIKLIQFLDTNVGHEQLRILFKYLLVFEKKDKFLIRPYSKIEKILYGKRFDPVILDFLFYLSLIFGIGLLGISALAIKIGAGDFRMSILVTIGLLVAFLCWQFCSLACLLRRRHRKVS